MTDVPMGRMLVDVWSCARCGDDHMDLVFLRLSRPIAAEADRSFFFTHWASCPATGEPVVMWIGTDPPASAVGG